jgi:hypothetical protein
MHQQNLGVLRKQLEGISHRLQQEVEKNETLTEKYKDLLESMFEKMTEKVEEMCEKRCQEVNELSDKRCVEKEGHCTQLTTICLTSLQSSKRGGTAAAVKQAEDAALPILEIEKFKNSVRDHLQTLQPYQFQSGQEGIANIAAKYLQNEEGEQLLVLTNKTRQNWKYNTGTEVVTDEKLCRLASELQEVYMSAAESALKVIEQEYEIWEKIDKLLKKNDEHQERYAKLSREGESNRTNEEMIEIDRKVSENLKEIRALREANPDIEKNARDHGNRINFTRESIAEIENMKVGGDTSKFSGRLKTLLTGSSR